MELKTVLIIALVLALAITLIYFVGFGEFKKYCESCIQIGVDKTLESEECTQRGNQACMQNTLQGIVNQIRLRNSAIEINVGEDKLICDVRGRI